jgi:uncharacterized SAM-binding protein YcdF (DUF218 family)
VKRAIRFAGVAALALAVACALFFTQILAALGSFLEKSESPRPAGAVFVLAGDPSGNRILKAAELVREGYAPEVIVSGPQESVYGFWESDLAISFAENAGYPKSYFLRFPSHALSTRDEAHAAAAEFHRLGLKCVILVTSDYHTRRAGNLFRAAAPGVAFVVVAAPDLHFTPRGWWRDREGRKIFLLEWMKTIAGWLHI